METGKYMLIKCPKCNELTPASRFCKNCGALDERIYAELEAEHCPHCGKKVATSVVAYYICKWLDGND